MAYIKDLHRGSCIFPSLISLMVSVDVKHHTLAVIHIAHNVTNHSWIILCFLKPPTASIITHVCVCVCVCVTVKELHNGQTFLHPCKMVKLKVMI